MGTQRLLMKAVLPWLIRRALCVSSRIFCPDLTALVGPVQHIFFFTLHYFNSFAPIAQQAWHAVVLGRLSLYVSNLLNPAISQKRRT
jgi:hypothetical protein